jgi:hypothetical protein
MVVTHSSSTQEKWQIDNMYRFQKTKCNDKEGSYPLSFTDEVLNIIIGYEAYFLLDGYLRYHEISIALKDRYKITFVTD